MQNQCMDRPSKGIINKSLAIKFDELTKCIMTGIINDYYYQVHVWHPRISVIV